MKKHNKNFIMDCDFCGSKTVVNFQKIWKKFMIDKNSKYSEDINFNGGDFEEPVEKDNIHLCKKHSEQWMNGEVLG